jgi:hypothetical protein
MILYAALDPSIASKAKKGEFVKCLDHFDLLQSTAPIQAHRPVAYSCHPSSAFRKACAVFTSQQRVGNSPDTLVHCQYGRG